MPFMCLNAGNNLDKAKKKFLDGLAHLEAEEYLEAQEAFNKSLEFAPNRESTLINLAATLIKLKEFSSAKEICFNLIKSNKSNAEAYLNLGIISNHLYELDESLSYINQALEVNPSYPEAWLNRGNVLNSLERYQDALKSYDYAIKLRSNYVDAFLNKGNTLNKLRQRDQAMLSYAQALELNPNSAETLFNVGNAFCNSKYYDEAIRHYNKAIQLKPNFYDAHLNKALAMLVCGKFQEGWQSYDFRWLKNGAEFYKYKNIPELQLDSNIAKKKILIWSEQGYGDTLLFTRYIPELIKMGAIVTFEVQKPLKELLQNNLACEVTDKVEKERNFDFQAPLLTLPKIFGTTLNTIPSNHPYLIVNENQSKKWRDKLKLSTSKINIGLAISGNPGQQTNSERSIPLEKIHSLSKYGNLYIIQNYLFEKDQKYLANHPEINYLGDHLVDFTDTAGIVSSMDIIISSCTSLAHLAGSINKKTFLMSKWAPDWRWLLDREDSPWYPSIKIFRQHIEGDWSLVINSIKNELSSLNHLSNF